MDSKKTKPKASQKRYKNNNILVFGDLHAPAHHKDTVKFLAKLSESLKFDRIICTGDLLDQYCLSRFPNSPGADNVEQELKKAKKVVGELGKIFPNMTIVSSNHDSRLYQKGTVNGIPKEALIPYMTLIGAPEGWRLVEDIKVTIDSTRGQLYIAHTRSGSTLSAAKGIGCNVAFGHKHNQSGVQYANLAGKTVWAADVGCLLSDEGYQFSYNKLHINRPVRSVLVVVDGTPTVINMDATIKMWKKEKIW